MSKKVASLCIDAYYNRVQEYNAKESSEMVRQAFIEIFGTDRPTMDEFEDNQRPFFAIIKEVLADAFPSVLEGSPFFRQFVEYRDNKFGDKNEFVVEDKSVLTISKISGEHWNLRRQKLDIGDTFSVKTEWYGAKIYTDFMRFLTNRIDWTAFVNKINEALKIQIATEIYGSFMQTMAFLPAEFKDTGSFSEDNMLDIVAHVETANGYRPVVIAGTRKALKAMMGSYTGVNSFLMSEKMKDELNQVGQLTTWNGVPLLEIPQVHIPNTFEFRLDDKNLMILPASTKPIKFFREGDSMISKTTDPTKNMDMSMEYTYMSKWGVACLFDMAYGMYQLD